VRSAVVGTFGVAQLDRTQERATMTAAPQKAAQFGVFRILPLRAIAVFIEAQQFRGRRLLGYIVGDGEQGRRR
jgi:hypothetical protein